MEIDLQQTKQLMDLKILKLHRDYDKEDKEVNEEEKD